MSHAQLSPCSNCGDLHPPDSLTIFEGSHLCPTCLARETVICHSCGDRIWVENDAGDSHTHLCESCRSDYYRCTNCGRLIHEDDACYSEDNDDDPYCGSCIENVDTRSIHSYNYKPEPLFFGDGPRYFGVELEIDGAGEYEENARAILDVANLLDEHIYIKRDGSLNEGLEIVTEPMSLDYHLNKMPWLAVCEKAVALGYRSHQTGTCGLHVHVSRKAFGETREEQDIAIARVLYFVEAHWNELLKFSRRTPRQLEQWAARYGYKEHPGEMLETVKKNCASRYTCVNLINYSTIEFRIFRGTLKLNTIIATLQLVNRVCDVAIHLSDKELKALSWSEFVSSVTEPELIAYLKERSLYLNDPVESEAEI